MTHPQVMDAAVCGIYNKDGTSEVPIAYITTDFESSVDQQSLKTDIVSYVNGQVARYERIIGGVHILPAIPRKYFKLPNSPNTKWWFLLLTLLHSPSGKILRRLVPANLAAAAAANSSSTAPNTQPLARL